MVNGTRIRVPLGRTARSAPCRAHRARIPGVAGERGVRDLIATILIGMIGVPVACQTEIEAGNSKLRQHGEIGVEG